VPGGSGLPRLFYRMAPRLVVASRPGLLHARGPGRRRLGTVRRLLGPGAPDVVVGKSATTGASPRRSGATWLLTRWVAHASSIYVRGHGDATNLMRVSSTE